MSEPKSAIVSEASPTEGPGAVPEPASATLPTSTSTSAEPAREEAASATAPGHSQQTPSLDIDSARPKDFKGEVSTDHSIPSAETLAKLDDYIVLDRHGRTHTFKSLYSANNVARRMLVIFIRHFFCGNCQEYIRSLAESITTESLLQLPISTFITVVGCGDPGLIEMYAEATKCPFPIYTDPKGTLFSSLGMVKTLAPGTKPAYMKKSMFAGAMSSIAQGLKQIPKGLALKAGDHRQVGGEFLFEPYDFGSPINTPQEEMRPDTQRVSVEEEHAHPAEEKRITWCHRMKSTRDHAEIPEVMEILGLDGTGKPIKDEARWAKAMLERKGAGSSLATRMGELSAAEEAEATK